MSQISPNEYLADQLRSAYDVYLELLRQIKARVAAALGRKSEDEHGALLCPPCFYTLVREPALIPRFLATMDGNNSLKLIDSAYRSGKTRTDDRILPWHRWIEPEEVDKYENEVRNASSRKKVRM
jgi:hypothetical protein